MKSANKKTFQKLGYIPDAILINVPDAFFKHEGKIKGDREQAFRRYYETMGSLPGLDDDACFYHFISSIPTIEVQWVYVCFRGYVQYKAILVKFMRNEPVMLATYQHPRPRNWCVTTGPVIKAPEQISMKGFRGFKYTKELF